MYHVASFQYIFNQNSTLISSTSTRATYLSQPPLFNTATNSGRHVKTAGDSHLIIIFIYPRILSGNNSTITAALYWPIISALEDRS
jgi:hypothetical protein